MLDSVLNKKDSLERCIQQIHRYYTLPSDKPFAEDFMKQDAISVNLQRAAQLCIDLANITIRRGKLGLPKDSSDSFSLLVEAGIIDKTMGLHLKGMVGFRNVLVHEYTKLDLSIMVDVIENHLDELIAFAQLILLQFKDDDA
jgi:uncharacterized protein YutE (UPF0331/DUF86 family)